MDGLFGHVLNGIQDKDKIIMIGIVKEFLMQNEYDSDAFILDLQDTGVNQNITSNSRKSNLYQLWGDHIHRYRNYMRYYKCMKYFA